MGLDVMLNQVTAYTPDHDYEHTITLYPHDTNKYMLAFFEKFKDYVVVIPEECYDNVATMKKFGYDYDKYDSDICSKTQEFFAIEEDIEMIFKVIDPISQEVLLVIEERDIILVNVDVKHIAYHPIHWQRSGMRKEFFTQYLAGCFYVSEDTTIAQDESMDIIYIQSDLDLAKTFAEPNQPIHEWLLQENQFVFFSY